MEKIRKELEKEILNAEALAEAWEAVKRVRTKAGNDYKIPHKNFSGCYGDAEKIYVSTFAGCTYHLHDEIKMEESVKYWKYGEVAEERIIKVPCRIPYFRKNADEIETEIKARAAMYRDRAERLKKQLANLETAVRVYAEKLSAALEELAENTGGKDSFLYYRVTEEVTRRNAKYYC